MSDTYGQCAETQVNPMTCVILQSNLQPKTLTTPFTDCGGCNVRFSHPLHYRMHCTVFHDLQFSLTIRKYHCKVCGLAVLGKENIVKHAMTEHDGKGAYQCQYCKKVREWFVRSTTSYGLMQGLTAIIDLRDFSASVNSEV